VKIEPNFVDKICVENPLRET